MGGNMKVRQSVDMGGAGGVMKREKECKDCEE